MKTLQRLVLALLSLMIFIPSGASAASGACSWHNGINCELGMQSSGKVYCTDGWTESTTYYDFTAKCSSTNTSSCTGYSSTCKYLRDVDLLNARKNVALKNLQAFNEQSAQYGFLFKDDFTQAFLKNSIIEEGYLKGNYMDYMCHCVKIDEIIAKWGEETTGVAAGTVYTPPTSTASALNCAKGHFPIKQIPGKCGTPIQFCDMSYGSNIRYTGILDGSGDPLCDCNNGYKWNSAHTGCEVSTAIASSITGIPEGAIIKTADNPDVYIVKYAGGKKYKRLILSPSVFSSYDHLKWEDLITVSQATMDSFTTSSYVRVAGDTNIFESSPQGDTGEKRAVTLNSSGYRVFNGITANGPFDHDAVYEINTTDRDSYISR